MSDDNPTGDDTVDRLAIDYDTRVAEAFEELLVERGYPTINEFMLDVLRQDASRKREARLRNLGARMFPDGVKTGRDDE